MKVKIENRSVYHKFVELEIEIPDSVEPSKINDYLLSIEEIWTDDINHLLKKARLVGGTGLYDHPGHEDAEAEDEWRFKCVEQWNI